MTPVIAVLLVRLVLSALVLAGIGWVAYDSAKYDWTKNRFCNAQWKWIVGCVFLFIVAFPLYLWQRRKMQALANRRNTLTPLPPVYRPLAAQSGASQPASAAPEVAADLFSSPG
jgi:hypothetical protein